MSAPAAHMSSPATGGLLADYLAHVATLELSVGAAELRGRCARSFLDAHPDLDAWMRRPLADRLVDLSRSGAWPFVCWAVLTRRAAADLELLVGRQQGGMHLLAERLFAHGFATVRAAAGRLGWQPRWVEAVVVGPLTLAVAFSGRAPQDLADEDLDMLAGQVAKTMAVTAGRRIRLVRDVGRLRAVLYEAKIVDRRHRRSRPSRHPLEGVDAAEVRRVIGAYLETRSPTLRPGSLTGITNDLACFGEFLSSHHRSVTRLGDLDRSHIESFCAWVPTRPWRAGRKPGQTISGSAAAHNVITVRTFLDDITAWGWADAPSRRLMFASDIPRQPDPLPRALPRDVDTAVMNAVANLDDPIARIGLTVIRATGLRVGELIDLEIDCVVDYGTSGSWLRVPLGKLATERTVPLDDTTLAALDDWVARRGPQRAIPHPRHGRPTDFLFVEHGQQPTTARLRAGLTSAVRAAGLSGPDGAPLRVTPHQLRHTFATDLANAGMSLQALMALLGHTSPEMTLRYARLASPTVKAAYDQAIGKLARRIPISASGKRPKTPERETWLRSEMLKTRVAQATARETSPPTPAPTPTSAKPAPATPPPPTSLPPSTPN